MITITYPDTYSITVPLLEPDEVRDIVNRHCGKPDGALHHPGTARTYRLHTGQILLEFYDFRGLLFADVTEYGCIKSVEFFSRKGGPVKDPGLFSHRIAIGKSEAHRIAKHYGNEEQTSLDFYPASVFYKLQDNMFVQIPDSNNDDENSYLYPNLESIQIKSDALIDDLYDIIWQEETTKFLHGEIPTKLDHILFYLNDEDFESVVRSHKLILVEKLVIGRSRYILYKAEQGYYILCEDFAQQTMQGESVTIAMVRYFENEKACNEAMDYMREWNAQYQKNGGAYSSSYSRLEFNYGEAFPNHTSELIALLPELLNIDCDVSHYTAETWATIVESVQWNNGSLLFFKKTTLLLIAYLGEAIQRVQGGYWRMKCSDIDGTWEPHLYDTEGKEVDAIIQFLDALWRVENGDYYKPDIEKYAVWFQ